MMLNGQIFIEVKEEVHHQVLLLLLVMYAHTAVNLWESN
jgi:hypothetical protein